MTSKKTKAKLKSLFENLRYKTHEKDVQASAKNKTRAILCCILAIIISVGSVLVFVATNNERIVEQNSKYLEGSTVQTAKRTNDLMKRSLDIVETAAAIYEKRLIHDEITEDPKTVAKSLKITSFDYTFYITPDGKAYRDSDGQEADVKDRIYYINGIAGKSGVVAYQTGAWNDEDVLIFYAPVVHKDNNSETVVGIFCGGYRVKTISDFYMNAEIFGYVTPTYLVSPSGDIIARSETAHKDARTIEELLKDTTSEKSASEIYSSVQNGESMMVEYAFEKENGNAYITKLPDYNWMLIRVFPTEVTKTMIFDASLSGGIPIAGIVVAMIIIIYMLLSSAKNRQKLLLFERQNAERIIDTSTKLFYAMLVLDLETKKYEHLAVPRILANTVELNGNFDKITDAIVSISYDDYKESIRTNFSTEEMKKRLNGEFRNQGYYQFEQHIMNPENQDFEEEVWLHATILELERNKDTNDISKVLICVQNMTDTKQREIEAYKNVKTAYEAARYASQAKSDFLNSMSHDIRTPMNSIMGMTAIAGMHINEPARVNECLLNISSASQHLLGLINEVLDMAKIESGNITLAEESFELPELISNMLSIICPQVDAKNQNIHTNIECIKHENVIGDPTRLQQVFINIMGNAVKFTPEGGNVGFNIREIDSKLPDYACFEFEFEDDGVGMTKEFQETIFEPFSRAHDTRTQKTEGTGLGMSITKNVIDMMNGAIYVESEVGVGSKFTVIVNLKIDEQEQEIKENEKIKGRAIVIDDDENTCQVARVMMEDIGLDTEYRTSGAEGCQAILEADKTSYPFDIALIDWKMPGMSGIEVARKIREQSQRQIPIIIFSGYDWSIIEDEARDVGVDMFVMKPLFRSRLLKMVKGLLYSEDTNPLDQSKLLESCSYEGRRVLLAEDNFMASEIAKEIVGMTGAEVVHAENGQAAYEIIRDAEPGYFDIVLMDIQMPIKNGYEATKAIREEGENGRDDLLEIPIVALSADAFEEDIKNAFLSGMNAHLSKPLDITALVKALKKFIDGENEEGIRTREE